MDDLNSRPVDRGPSTDTGDGPQTPRGMWRLLAIPDVDHVRAMAIARHHYSWATLERAVPDRLTKLVGRKVAGWIAAHGIPDVDLPVPVDGTVMTPWSPEFPLPLRDIPGCPPILWVRGQLPDLTAVTLVGEPGWVVSDAVLRRAATGCAARQVTAVAVDVTAGRTALQAGCRTVLVTDGQATADDPTLPDQVVADGGAVVAELPPDWDDVPATTLAAAGRVAVGLGTVTLVAGGIAAGYAGSAGRFALVQDRPVWTVAPPAGHRSHPAAAVPVTLADPSGCDPAILGASGRLAGQLANRRPAAAQVLADGDQLDAAIGTLADQHPHP